MALRIYDTKSRDKVDFTPLEDGRVRIYVCGITPYAPSHVGHARSAVAFDVVHRWLEKKHVVTFVRNYTDVDDKIINASNATGDPCEVLTERYIRQYEADLEEMRCLVPDVQPRVSQHVPEVIDTIRRLEERGFAYRIDDDVYYDVTKFTAYGQLSGRRLDELEAGARVEVDERKRTPFDFVLWKGMKPGEPAWDSPWGKGRPGWHIECSAMATKYLGTTFDIHGGGKDLMFPHHENEIAQSCGAYAIDVLARVWMHNGFVNLMPDACPGCKQELSAASVEACEHCGRRFTEDELKMSKSRGNFYPIRDILSRYEGEALRLTFLNSHYRSPIVFSHKLVDEMERRLDRYYETIDAIDAFTSEQTFVPGKSFAAIFGFDPMVAFEEAMDDDFNASKALADFGEVFKIANELIRGGEKERIREVLSPENTSRLLAEIRQLIREAGDVLGLWQQDARAYLGRRKMARAKTLPVTPAQIEALIGERTDARKAKNFARADQIRDELRAKGIVLMDAKGVTTWSVEE
jgi:cysteinyl-tRNA synthetase